MPNLEGVMKSWSFQITTTTTIPQRSILEARCKLKKSLPNRVAFVKRHQCHIGRLIREAPDTSSRDEGEGAGCGEGQPRYHRGPAQPAHGPHVTASLQRGSPVPRRTKPYFLVALIGPLAYFRPHSHVIVACLCASKAALCCLNANTTAQRRPHAKNSFRGPHV